MVERKMYFVMPYRQLLEAVMNYAEDKLSGVKDVRIEPSCWHHIKEFESLHEIYDNLIKEIRDLADEFVESRKFDISLSIKPNFVDAKLEAPVETRLMDIAPSLLIQQDILKKLEDIIINNKYLILMLYALDYLLESIPFNYNLEIGEEVGYYCGNYQSSILNLYVNKELLNFESLENYILVSLDIPSKKMKNILRKENDYNKLRRYLDLYLREGNKQIIESIYKMFPKCAKKHKENAEKFWSYFFSSTKKSFEHGAQLKDVLEALLCQRRLFAIWCFRRIADIGLPILPEVKFKQEGTTIGEADLIIFIAFPNHGRVIEIKTSKQIEDKELNNVKKIASIINDLKPIIICRDDLTLSRNDIKILKFSELKEIHKIISALYER